MGQNNLRCAGFSIFCRETAAILHDNFRAPIGTRSGQLVLRCQIVLLRLRYKSQWSALGALSTGQGLSIFHHCFSFTQAVVKKRYQISNTELSSDCHCQCPQTDESTESYKMLKTFNKVCKLRYSLVMFGVFIKSIWNTTKL